MVKKSIRIILCVFLSLVLAMDYAQDAPHIDQASAGPEHTLALDTTTTPTQLPEHTNSDEQLTERELALIDQIIDQDIEINFNNASLQNIVDQISHLFNLTFIPDDVVKAPDASTKVLSESKVSFTTNKTLTKKKAWSLFTTFLELAGLALSATPNERIYRITTIDKANKSPLPTYINTSLDLLPASDQRIRYICFLENTTYEMLQPVLEKIKSDKCRVEEFKLLRAVILTDAAYNVYSLMQIIRELDKTSSSQVLSVINLKEAEATEVEEIIKKLQGKKDDQPLYQWPPPKKESTLFYFSKDVAVITSPRTNSLILVGPKEGVARIEQFILTHIDTSLKQRYEPVHVHSLNYAPAEQIAKILNEVLGFGKAGGEKGPTAAQTGSVVGGLKFFGDVHIEPEEQNNRLIIRSSEEDYAHLKKVIEQLDKRQLQVAIEVMILEIRLDRNRQWGIQWNTKKDRNINAQLSGFWGSGPRTKSTPSDPAPLSNSIISNLIGLAKLPEAGSTILTLGKNSIYAIAGILEADTQTRVIANPFVVATNKYRASVAIAESRRAISAQVSGTAGLSSTNSFDASWQISIKPQINEGGIVNLDIDVLLEDFIEPVSGTSAANANKTTTSIQTSTNVANGEVIALGGAIKKKKTANETRFPVLSRIPIIGNLFKNSSHENEQFNLVILMSPTIIYPSDEQMGTYTKNKADDMRLSAKFATERHERYRKDPLYRWFFKATDDTLEQDIEEFITQKVPEQAPLKPANANVILNAAVTSGEENQ